MNTPIYFIRKHLLHSILDRGSHQSWRVYNADTVCAFFSVMFGLVFLSMLGMTESSEAYAPRGITTVRPLDFDAVITGSHTQGEWVSFTHTLGPDSASLHPVKVYSQNYATMWGSEKNALATSSRNSFELFGNGRDGDLTVNPSQTVTINRTQVNISTSLSHSPLVIKSSGKCVKIQSGSLNDNALIVQWDCNGSDEQAWSIQPVGGYYQVVSKLSNKCLDVQGGSQANNTPVVQWDCHGGDNQLWNLQSIGGYYIFVAKHSGKCLDVSGGNQANDTSIIQWDCNSGDNQLFSYSLVRNNLVYLPMIRNPADQLPTNAPSWKILVLIYTSTDFIFTDRLGIQRHFSGALTQSEIDRVVSAVTRFVNTDIPSLNNRVMQPTVTIKYPTHALSTLSPMGCNDYAPRPSDIASDRDSTFDSVIAVYDGSGTDLITGQVLSIEACAWAFGMGIGQTYAAIFADFIHSNERNVLKHEWGHSITYYYEAAGTAPKPAVNNHINNTDTKYVNCTTGQSYILQDETDNNLISNSIYNNQSGFTHDYYSGQTATADQPTRCLGITSTAWASGGPVSRPLRGANENQSIWHSPADDQVTDAVPYLWEK